jgi:hypothetical protein
LLQPLYLDFESLLDRLATGVATVLLDDELQAIDLVLEILGGFTSLIRGCCTAISELSVEPLDFELQIANGEFAGGILSVSIKLFNLFGHAADLEL